MPTEETTTQVAPASDPADASVAQAEQTQTTQDGAAEANGETTPEPDIKAEWEKTKAELAQERTARAAAEKRALDADNLVRTQAGAQSASDRRLNDMARELKRQGAIIKAGLTTADGPAEIARLETNHRNEDQADFASFVTGQRQGIVAALKAAGFTEDDVNHEELADARNLWDVGNSLTDSRRIEAAVQSAARGIKRMQAAKQAEKSGSEQSKTAATSETSATNGAGRRIPNMDTGAGAGAGNISMPALLVRYGEDYESLTPAQRKSAEDYMRREGLI